MMIPKPSKVRSKKITQSAKGESCTLRIPSVCNHNNDTVVFAHLPGNKGTSTKNHDIFGVYACSGCHSWLDDPVNIYEEHMGLELLRALQETQLRLIDKGLVEVK